MIWSQYLDFDLEFSSIRDFQNILLADDEK